jgi:indole-3-glycerol phosphate synthase
MSTPTRAAATGESMPPTSTRLRAPGENPVKEKPVPSAFIDALLAGRLPIIMEVKRQDADGKALMGERTIPRIVSEYTAVGAPCISVVTGRWFGGNDEMLRQVAGLTDLPLLKKDFITREKQLVAAKEMGASAILLTARIMPKKPFQHLIELALEHVMTPFV